MRPTVVLLHSIAAGVVGRHMSKQEKALWGGDAELGFINGMPMLRVCCAALLLAQMARMQVHDLWPSTR